jgi:hypothetical protein
VTSSKGENPSGEGQKNQENYESFYASLHIVPPLRSWDLAWGPDLFSTKSLPYPEVECSKSFFCNRYPNAPEGVSHFSSRKSISMGIPGPQTWWR